MINIALVGLGYWGKNYLRVLREIHGASLIYVCDLIEESSKLLPQGIKFVSDYEELAQKNEINAAIISTPASTHYEITRKFLESGKDVLVEKPLTMASGEAADLIKIAKENKRILMVGHIYCYHPAVRYLRGMIINKKAGKIFYGMALRMGLGPIRNDASCTWDLATHDIAILDYIFKQKPNYVTATATSFLQKDKQVYDYAHIYLEYENMHFSVTSSWYSAEKIRSLWIEGSRYLIKFDDMNKDWPIMIYRSNLINIKDQSDYKGTIFMPRIPKDEPLLVQTRHFVECVRLRKKPLTDGYQGLSVIEILEAAERAIKQGKKVKLK